jgi:spore coat protein U-like protein
MLPRTSGAGTPLCLAFLVWLKVVSAADVLSTSGFTDCGTGVQDVSVQQFHLAFDRSTKNLDFAVAGTSNVSQNVTAQINVTALGNLVYTKSFNPCE